jgi:hypothetical protein
MWFTGGGNMEKKNNTKVFEGLKREYLERKIFLKRQLILLTKKEISALEHELIAPSNK